MSTGALADGGGRRVSDGAGGSPGAGRGPMATLVEALARAELGALFALAAAAALGVGLILWALRPGWVPVGEGVGRGGALAVVDLLATSGIEHRLDPASGLVLVPADRAGEVRARVAAAGLGPGDGVGLEMLSDEPALGTSQFTETRRYQHALETELARTISGMRGVDTARVHLALPNRSVFVRDREAASASVMVQTEAGRALDDEQVDAIRRLVAAGIPYLGTGDVTVVDRLGRLLSDDDGEHGASRENFARARRIERLYAERIEALLTPLVGEGRVRATVTADIDFSMEEQTAESFEPDPAQLRSEQSESLREVGDAAGLGGVPGSLVNQPPEGGVAAGAADPVADAAGADAGDGTVPVTTSQSAVRNFELDRTITHVRRSPGTIRRVSAAVVVDDRVSTDENGETVRTPLEAAEIEQFTALAREAIGFDEARGDSVVVANRGFQEPEPLEPLEEPPLWEQPWVAPLVREAAIGLAVLLLVWVGVRPALGRVLGASKANAASPAAARLEALDREERNGGGAGERSSDGSGSGGKRSSATERALAHGDILATARALAADDPKRVARLVKDWVGEPR